jgi:hypothetical protein
MLNWKISTGELFGPDGSVWGKGYSGHFEGVNNPDKQSQPNVGPIPEGTWTFGLPFDSPKTGKFVMRLTPCEGTNTYGRSDFEIHGDLVHAAGQHLASHGCIILPRSVRDRMADETDRTLNVTR